MRSAVTLFFCPYEWGVRSNFSMAFIVAVKGTQLRSSHWCCSVWGALFRWVLALQDVQVWVWVGCWGLGGHPAHPIWCHTAFYSFSRAKDCTWGSQSSSRSACFIVSSNLLFAFFLLIFNWYFAPSPLDDLFSPGLWDGMIWGDAQTVQKWQMSDYPAENFLLKGFDGTKTQD